MCAVFNPQVQQGNDDMPNYFKYSEPIKNVEADISTGIALKTAGIGIEGGAELADSTVKGIIKNDTYNRVDAERDSFTGFLDATKNPAPTQPTDIMAQNGTSVPTAVSNGLQKAGTIQAGLDGQKVSETTYYQRLNSITKDLRATYPGYRDYIDSEVSKITGVTPANAYISSIIQDINRQNANSNKDKEFWQHQIVSNSGFPDSAKMLQDYNQTGDSNKVMQWLATNQGPIEALKLKKATFESQDQDKTTQTKNASDYADSAINHAATIAFTNKKMFGGMAPSDISDRMVDLTMHPEKANDVAYQNLGAQYEAMKVQTYNQTAALLNTRSKGPDGKLLPSVADIIGPEAVKKKLTDGIGALFDKTSEFIANKQFSPAYALQQAAEGTVNNAYFKTLTDPTIGGRITTAAVLNKAAPNLSPVIVGKLLGDGLDPDLSTFVKEQGKQAIAQTGGSYTGSNGKVYSFRQSLEEQNRASVASGQPVSGQALSNLLEIRKAITDPKTDDQGKSNAIKYFYDTPNKGVMDKFMDDYYDPTKGGVVKGRTSAFAALTADDVTKSIWDHSQNHPAEWMNYSNWAKGEFSTQLRNQIGDLDTIQKESERPPSDFFSMDKPQGAYKIAWDSDKHQLLIKNHDGSDLTGLYATPLNGAYRAVTNLNIGLKNLANIAKTEGSNVDAYVFKTLKDAGFSPSKDIDGVPAQVMRAMITSNGGKLKNVPDVPISK